ncbi:MAG: bacillithiol system redox-active protein YtxJ, partial [Flavobacteriaceae bacterium]|nr:bacillithiol system redox-active protein YtxJ [Flavobacteriaceae bacterium]
MFGLFGDKKESEAAKIEWHSLTTVDQLDTIVEESKSLPVAIFKHSTRCGISRMVLRSFEKQFDLDDSQMKMYFLDLIANREVSNEVAAKFDVIHQSPQLIVIQNGKATAA